MKTRTFSSLKLQFLIIIAALIFYGQQDAWATQEQGDDNPTGVSGIYNGQITTAGNYDGYTGNAMRVVDDIVVPGSVGAYPLKWTRYFNSHVTSASNKMGGSWRFSYLDYKHFNADAIGTPDGRLITGDYGTEEYVDNPYPGTVETLHLSDGGKVVATKIFYYQGYPLQLNFFYPTQIIDPYGAITTLTWVYVGGNAAIKLDKITEPGGRYLKITWDATNSYITLVQAFDGVNASPTQSVTYTWSNFTLGGNTVKVLSRADYSDTSYATYSYTDQTYPGPPICSYPYYGVPWHAALIATADDVRYNGPMRQIAYEYYAGAGQTSNKTRVHKEKNLVTGEAVSTIDGISNDSSQAVTETRGDGPTRSFYYYKYPGCRDCPPPDTDPCPRDPAPTDGKLSNYTDFLGHTTTLSYETDPAKPSAGFVTGVTDVNGNTTTYTRSAVSYAIMRITFPPTPTEPSGSHIDQTFTDETHPYYLSSKTDELGRTTSYTRDANNRITRKDYPIPDARPGLDPSPAPVWETFSYNAFNEVTGHRLTNNGTESYTYDSRGLKTSYTDPLGNVTTYSYYTTGPWTDRIYQVTYPFNASGVRAVETYDYDRAYDANGENSGASTGQAPVAGRGLVTRITHFDGKFQSFGYDKYGNKLWQADELNHRTTMTYDAYKRVLTVTDPLNHTVTNNYVPTGQTSSWITTSSLPFYTTLPSTKKTTFYYDANWRKTRVQQAPGTADEANTYFTYDNLGNQLTVQDPAHLNHGRFESCDDIHLRRAQQ